MSAEKPREWPILFNDQMVRAILEGRKTVTRRVVTPQPDFLGSMVDPNTPFKTLDAGLHARITCPYGEPGDRLWVREAWAADAQVDAIAPSDLSQGEPIWYPADLSVRQTGCSMISKGRVRPSIHMPRWASRILLEITAVRVERLQDISEEQARAEDIPPSANAKPAVVAWMPGSGSAPFGERSTVQRLSPPIPGSGSSSSSG